MDKSGQEKKRAFPDNGVQRAMVPAEYIYKVSVLHVSYYI